MQLLRKNFISNRIFAVRSFMRLKCEKPVINFDSKSFVTFTNIDAHSDNVNLKFSYRVRKKMKLFKVFGEAFE